MKTTARNRRAVRRFDGERRRGNITVLSAIMLVPVCGFAAFTVDIGYVVLTKAQSQTAADAGSLAAALELPANIGLGATMTPTDVEAAAHDAAEQTAAANRSLDRNNIYVDGGRDMRFGQAVWDPDQNRWSKLWGVSPYNMVEVVVRRDQTHGAPDGPIDLFLAPVIGVDRTGIVVRSTAALVPGVGFQIHSESNRRSAVLPIALDEPTWDNLILHGVGTDEYTWHEDDGTITPGPDGVLEVDLYPYGNHELPPGNRGTVDIGDAGNSTADIKRQILEGLSAEDLEPHGGVLSFADGPLLLNGDTGISAGIKAQLEQIKGKPRAIPIFVDVHGNGNNAYFTIVKFVGIRIMHVKLTGNPKRVVIQPAAFVDATIIQDKSGNPIDEHGIFGPPTLVE